MAGVQLQQMITALLFLVIVLLTIRTVLDMNDPYQESIRPEKKNLERLQDALRESSHKPLP